MGVAIHFGIGKWNLVTKRRGIYSGVRFLRPRSGLMNLAY